MIFGRKTSIDGKYYSQAVLLFSKVHGDQNAAQYAKEAALVRSKADAYYHGWIDGARYCLLRLDELVAERKGLPQ